VVRVGLDYDLWFDRLLAQAGKREIQRGGPGYVDASFAIAALEVRGMSVGPATVTPMAAAIRIIGSIPKNAEIITGNILEALARIDPANAALRGQSAGVPARLQAKLAGMGKAGAAQGMPMVAYHNSWPYFARRFRLDFVGFIETKPGVPPSPSHLAGIVRPCRRAACVSSCASRTSRNAMWPLWRQGRRVGCDAGRVGRRAAGRRRLHRAVRRQCRGAAAAGAR
jgi:ABC-type Zn uptake system ZnuABC Zn-binding protein ZnuA